MEGDLDDCEFWLPSEFLTDDDFVMEFKQSRNEGNKCFHRDFSYGLGGFGTNSGLSSPGESVVGSTETESDEDDYITELTRKMAHSTLEENNSFGYEASKAWGFSGSPKSPLCKYSSNRCSPRFASQVPSTHEGAWYLLCAAAEEVSRSRMKMVEESAGFYPSRNGPIVPPRKPSPISVRPENTGPNSGFSSNQTNLSYQQLQAAWFEQLKRQQMMKQQQQQQQQANGVWGQGKGGCGLFYQSYLNQQTAQSRGRNGAVGLSMSAWPTLQQSQQQQQPQPGSGMRAVFLGNPSAKRECAGTGVFLPRRIGSPTEPRKNNPACSTVLLPDRVVHALNLNLEPVDAQPQVHPRYNANAALKYNKDLLRAQAQQRQTSMRPQPMMNQEVRLPQE